DSG
ncbi:hypothetical protein AB1N83_002348, partial [Pleurotus pulmonarius]